MTRPNAESGPEPRTVDLHGLKPDQALRRLTRAVHTARVKGEIRLLAITGRGWGNLDQRPVLRRHVEDWLQSDEGRNMGVEAYHVVNRGGALDIRLS